MNPQRIAGIVLLTLGIVLLIVGMNASDSVADRVSNTFTGRFTERTTLYIGGGIVSGVLGVSLLLFGSRKGA
jgi:hypothetical protein